jgi:hypothetical protein
MAPDGRDGTPPLRLIHEPSAMRPSSVAFWSRRSTSELVASLAPGATSPLIVAADGTVLDGNTRVWVLRARGFPVDALPRSRYEERD